jgi:oligosaccharide:H+ symporter
MKIIKGNKTVLQLLLTNAFIYIAIAMYSPFLSSYYSRAGMNAVEIGILLTIGPVSAILIQPLWAFISDRTGHKKAVLSLVAAGSGISMISYYAGNSFLSFFIASLLLAVFSTSIIPLSDALILRITQKHEMDFSKIRIGGTIGYAVMVIIAGLIVKQNPKLQFGMGAVGYLILLLFVRRLPKDEEVTVKETGHSEAPTVRKSRKLLDIFETKQVYFLLAFAFINQVGLNFIYTFLGVYMLKLGLSEGMIGFINSVSACSEIPILFLINKILKKTGTMKLIILSCVILAVRLFMVTGSSVPIIIMAQLLHGLTFMTVYYSCAVFISKNVKKEYQSQGQSILTIIQSGIGSIVGNIAGGFFVDYFGLKSAYTYMSAMVFFLTLVITVSFFAYQKLNKNAI